MSLQRECSALRSEKQELLNKSQKERGSLQSECASLRAEKEELLRVHQKEKGSLQSECAGLRSEREAILKKQQQLEKDLVRSVVPHHHILEFKSVNQCLCQCCTHRDLLIHSHPVSHIHTFIYPRRHAHGHSIAL